MPFTDEQLGLLTSKLEAERIKTRKQGSTSLKYIEGYDVIRYLNLLTDFNWSHAITDLTYNEKGSVYIARVRLIVPFLGESYDVSHEDVGAGPVVQQTAMGHETAVKASVTDALKRAARCLGDKFGNGLYDKDFDMVRDTQSEDEVQPKNDDFAQKAAEHLRTLDHDKNGGWRKEVCDAAERIKAVTSIVSLDKMMESLKKVQESGKITEDEYSYLLHQEKTKTGELRTRL